MQLSGQQSPKDDLQIVAVPASVTKAKEDAAKEEAKRMIVRTVIASVIEDIIVAGKTTAQGDPSPQCLLHAVLNDTGISKCSSWHCHVL